MGIMELFNLRNAISPKVVVSYGNQLDIDPADLVQYFEDDPVVDVIGLYIEGFKEGAGRRFFDVTSRCRKPVIVYKAGRTEEGRQAAQSHTASIAGEYEVAKAAMKQAGLIVAGSMIAHGDFVKTFALLADFQWEGLRRWVESYPSTFLFQAHPLLAAAALAALWQGWRDRDRRVFVAAALPLVLFALGARRSRYLLPAFPMIALLAARGLESLPGRARRFAVLAAVGFSLVTVFAVYLPFLRWVNTANLMEAGRYLDERGIEAVEVTVVPAPEVAINPEVAVPLLDYHTAARIVVRGPAPPRPPEDQLRASSFRFSWERPLPSWYRVDESFPPSGAAQVLVTGEPDATPPALAFAVAGRSPDAVFTRDAVFRYRTFVSVWMAPPAAVPAP